MNLFLNTVQLFLPQNSIDPAVIEVRCRPNMILECFEIEE